eukprot:s1_g21.t1
MGKKLTLQDRRKQRNRAKLRKLAGGRPRLSVHRSSQHIYAQVIDDTEGKTIASASSMDKEFKGDKGTDVTAATEVGKLVAKRASDAGVTDVVFDRGETFIVARRESRDREERDSEFVDKLVHINRVAKVVKGGRRFGFAALVVIGDQKGRVGFGHGKAREVPEAIRKATESAKRNLIRVPLREGRTLHHDIHGRHGAGRVILRAAPPGTGIIAGGPMRAVFETLGVQDVVAKSMGSANPYNMVRATFDALKREQSPRMVAARRGKKVTDIVGRRADGAGEALASE